MIPLVIAEAGVNHNGNVKRALRLVEAAAEARADYCKFQAFRASSIVSAHAATARYQKSNTGVRRQYDLLRSLELTLEEFARIAVACRKARIGFLVTPFDLSMAAPLVAMGMDRIKVPSGEITNTPLLRALAKFKLPMIVSTGMATLTECREALSVLRRAGAHDLTFLHCTSLYPAPVSALNLRAMAAMGQALGRPVGYSDHSLDDHAAIAATALGASVIEKHFTLDRSLPGPDHKASLEPDELITMVKRIRETAQALGDGIKRPVPAERAVARLVRRSWHTARAVPAGARLTEADIVLKRPASGIAPSARLVGSRVRRNLRADQPIREADVERRRS